MKLPLLASAALLLLSASAFADSPRDPDGYLTLNAGVVDAQLSNGGLADQGTGTELAAALRLEIVPRLILDATFDHTFITRSSNYNKLDTQTAALGYLGSVGKESSWYAEGVYSRNQISFDAGHSQSINAPGVRGGWRWPFAHKWYSTLDLGAEIPEHFGNGGKFAQAEVGAGLGYQLTNHVGFGFNLDEHAFLNSGSSSTANAGSTHVFAATFGIGWYW